jgi:hypothetical protein
MSVFECIRDIFIPAIGWFGFCVYVFFMIALIISWMIKLIKWLGK